MNIFKLLLMENKQDIEREKNMWMKITYLYKNEDETHS